VYECVSCILTMQLYFNRLAAKRSFSAPGGAIFIEYTFAVSIIFFFFWTLLRYC
uniref:Uncharacterized protein n=1 Tax=Parascaris univalens TaxID=6257 RepID=A0A915AUU1_PARUN